MAAGGAGVDHGAGGPALHGARQEQRRHQEAAPGDQEEQVEHLAHRLQPGHRDRGQGLRETSGEYIVIIVLDKMNDGIQNTNCVGDGVIKVTECYVSSETGFLQLSRGCFQHFPNLLFSFVL